jgi:anti-sigma factor RsiW
VNRCKVTDAELGDHLDRRLSLDESRRLDRHLNKCDSCRGTYEDLVAVRSFVDRLPTSIEPPRDLWPELSARLSSGPQSGRRRFRLASWFMLSAAAAVLVVIGAKEQFSRVPSGSDPAENAVAESRPAADDNLQLEIARAEQAYVDAAGDFLAQLDASQAGLPQSARDILQGNLVIAEEAISEIKSAWRQQPNDMVLARKLLAAHEKRVDLLQHVVQLSITIQNGS